MHQVAQSVAPDARVVYVDNDPIVLVHGRALLANDETTTVVDADLRDPDAVLTHPKLAGLVDLSQPVAVLFLAVLHFVPDDAKAGRIVAAYADVVAPASYLAVSHVTDHPAVTAHTSAYEEAVSPVRGRIRAQVERFFDGFDLVGPGLVDLRAWPEPDTADTLDGLGIGGVARKS